jgi:hypothetical protein
MRPLTLILPKNWDDQNKNNVDVKAEMFNLFLHNRMFIFLQPSVGNNILKTKKKFLCQISIIFGK